jgi:hypothetical protein
MTPPRSTALEFAEYLHYSEGQPIIASRIVAKRAIASMEPCIAETSEHMRLEASYDERGDWHAPNPIDIRDRMRRCGRAPMCYVVAAAIFATGMAWPIWGPR